MFEDLKGKLHIVSEQMETLSQENKNIFKWIYKTEIEYLLNVDDIWWL